MFIEIRGKNLGERFKAKAEGSTTFDLILALPFTA